MANKEIQLTYALYGKQGVMKNLAAEYFIDQWNKEDSFNSWKIFWSAPGVATANNALESFNKTIKKNFTLGTRHLLPFLFNIVMEKLLFNFSLDIIMERKSLKRGLMPSPKYIWTQMQ